MEKPITEAFVASVSEACEDRLVEKLIGIGLTEEANIRRRI